MKLAETIAQPVGMPIVNLTVRVSSAYKTREVNTAYGAKSIQDLVVEDDTAQGVKLTWWAPTMDSVSMKGAIININARLNQKNAMAGATIKQDKDKDGNPRPQLNVTGDHLLLCDAQGKPMAAPTFTPPAAPQQSQQWPNTNVMPQSTSPFVPPLPPQPPETQWEQSAQPLPTKFVPTLDRITETQLFDLAGRALNYFVDAFTFRGLAIEAAPLAACVNTVLIAATNRNLIVEPAKDSETPF